MKSSRLARKLHAKKTVKKAAKKGMVKMTKRAQKKHEDKRASAKKNVVKIKDTVRPRRRLQSERKPAAEVVTVISEEIFSRTRGIIADGAFKEHLSKTVGGGAGAIINALLDGPKADEKLSEVLNIKPNETRRVLNVLNSYGIVRYNINKDSNGWLTFLWYIDHDSVVTVRDQLTKSMENTKSLPQDCNDFFACPACSVKHALVLPFEIAFDASFKCTCGKSLKRVSREEAMGLYGASTG